MYPFPFFGVNPIILKNCLFFISISNRYSIVSIDIIKMENIYGRKGALAVVIHDFVDEGREKKSCLAVCGNNTKKGGVLFLFFFHSNFLFFCWG